jgi:hypothetical protein
MGWHPKANLPWPTPRTSSLYSADYGPVDRMMRVLSRLNWRYGTRSGLVRYLTRSGLTDAERVVACGGHAGRDRWSGRYGPVIR